MVFSSLPIYQDSPNSWNQQRAQLLQLPRLAEPSPQPTGPENSARPVSMAERARLAKIPPPDLARIKCPRCDSNNTKFCYFNNYSLSQPRYFCKTCRRYWTRGGALREVPVGGGCRRKKRCKTSPSPSEPMLPPPPKSPRMSPFRHASANLGLEFCGIQQGNPAAGGGSVALEQYRLHIPPPPPPPPFLGGGFEASPAALGFLPFDGEGHVISMAASEKIEDWDGGELGGNGSGGEWLGELPGFNSSSFGLGYL